MKARHAARGGSQASGGEEQEWEHLAAQKNRGGGQDHAGGCQPFGRVLGQAAPDVAGASVHPAGRDFGHVAEVGPETQRHGRRAAA